MSLQENPVPLETLPDWEGEYQEIYRRLLDDLPIGRSVEIMVPADESKTYTPQEQNRMGVNLPDSEKKIPVRLFHALPTDREGTAHLIIDGKGSFLLIRGTEEITL